jgi:hypothetical protein
VSVRGRDPLCPVYVDTRRRLCADIVEKVSG